MSFSRKPPHLNSQAMTTEQCIEAIKKIDILLQTQELDSSERQNNLRNRDYLMRKVFENGDFTKLINANLLKP